MLSVDECSHYNDHLDTLSVQCKLKDSVCLEACYGTWNSLMLGCHPGQLSFILHVASDTLPTAVNLQRWHIQCNAKCPILNSCSTALSQGHFTYWHDLALNT